MIKRLLIASLLLVAAIAIPSAQPPAEKLDLATIAKIRDEGLNRSQVMDHIGWLSDVYGPRLTGGPGIRQAADWTLKKFGEWGLANPHLETFPFGKGWSLVRFSAHLIEPQVEPLIGFPGSWTPGTNGAVIADVVRVQAATEADFEKYRGTLKGKIVLTQPARAVRMLEGPFVLRMTEEGRRRSSDRPDAGRVGGGRVAAATPSAAAEPPLFSRSCRPSTKPKASSRSSTAAAIRISRPAAATCPGFSSGPTAARSSPPAAARAAPMPPRGFRR